MDVNGLEIAPLGDTALLLRTPAAFDNHSVGAAAVLVHAAAQIEAAKIPGVTETSIGYSSIAIFLDPAAAIRAGAPLDEIFSWISRRVEEALRQLARKTAESLPGRIVKIPVCYEREFAIDLDHVARHSGMAADAVIELHAGATYRVRCVGFTPGFPYLTGLSRQLATPRRATPRKEVAAGSVGIGGSLAGIYPTASPGGWNVVGRTPLPLFDPDGDPPALLCAGDKVRFYPISKEQFNEARTVAAVYDRRNAAIGSGDGSHRQPL